MNNGVNVIALGQFGIGIEKAMGQAGAAHHAKIQRALVAGGGCCAGAAHRAGFAVAAELVEVHGVLFKTVADQLHGEVLCCGGLKVHGFDKHGQRFVLEHIHAASHGAVGVFRRNASPQHHAVKGGVAAGHAVQKLHILSGGVVTGCGAVIGCCGRIVVTATTLQQA